MMSDDEHNTVHAEKLPAGSRTYFFDVKASNDDKLYLCITETRSSAGFERHRVMIFQEHMAAFHEAYLRAAECINVTTKSYSVETLRQEHPQAYKKWTPDEDEELTKKYNDGLKINELAAILERKPSAIRSRLGKLGLLPLHTGDYEDT